jgi:hypothetical protein
MFFLKRHGPKVSLLIAVVAWLLIKHVDSQQPPIAETPAIKVLPKTPPKLLLTALEDYFAETIAPQAALVPRTHFAERQDFPNLQVSRMGWLSPNTLGVLYGYPGHQLQIVQRSQKPLPLRKLQVIGKNTEGLGVSQFVLSRNVTGVYTFSDILPSLEAFAEVNATTGQIIPTRGQPDLKKVLLVQFGKKLSSEANSRESSINIFDGTGRLKAATPIIKDVYVCAPTVYAVAKVGNTYMVTFAGVATKREALSQEVPPTNIYLITLSATIHSRVLSIAQVRKKDLRDMPEALKSHLNEHGLFYPTLVPSTGDLLFQRLWYADNEDFEEANGAELWLRKANGKALLIDAVALYRTPPYNFSIDEQGKVAERFGPSDVHWGITAEMAPAVSPDGKTVSYMKQDSFWSAKVPE